MKNKNCDFCNCCNSCDSCDFCDFCHDCKNLVNGFMCTKFKLKKKDENRYWIFNKEVSREEWGKRFEISHEEKEVCNKCGQEIK